MLTTGELSLLTQAGMHRKLLVTPYHFLHNCLHVKQRIGGCDLMKVGLGERERESDPVSQFSNYDTCSSYHKPKDPTTPNPSPFTLVFSPATFLFILFHSIATAFAIIACFLNNIDDTTAAVAVCRAWWSQTPD
ncbi:hypothetical protein RHSIM_Rhsim08G0099400 [Rhododendron simsii]|uniref:Uncharacterized protein n=1 Tax=Rhododendron simsii TaxID=118357 RepID=A0A834GMZ8_RHOSS|nr:hypothetical protein RHSIM_Rhsim08G0099400 [Rhododendron simsii]